MSNQPMDEASGVEPGLALRFYGELFFYGGPSADASGRILWAVKNALSASSGDRAVAHAFCQSLYKADWLGDEAAMILGTAATMLAGDTDLSKLDEALAHFPKPVALSRPKIEMVERLVALPGLIREAEQEWDRASSVAAEVQRQTGHGYDNPCRQEVCESSAVAYRKVEYLKREFDALRLALEVNR